MSGPPVSAGDISPALRDDLIAYLMCDSADRARLIADLLKRNPGMGDLLAELEADDDLRARLELELLHGNR
jgi:hypothetical protein